MPSYTSATTIRTLDGLRLAGTVVATDGPPNSAALIVCGGAVTSEEGGFYARLAAGLGGAGIASLRYDLRGYGESEGLREESALTAHLNDIRVARAHLVAATGVSVVHLVGTGFGGGLAAFYAAKRPLELTRLALLNPLLDYKGLYIEQNPSWHGDFLADHKASELSEHGYLDHTPDDSHSRPFLNELFWIQPQEVIPEVRTPTLLVHGTMDTSIPIHTTRTAAENFRTPHRLVEIDGADHGFAIPSDPQFLDPQTRKWQAFVIRAVRDWFTNP
ncbi:alpha/beta hydrolase [Nocardia bovistercoris]|uniref:Alpha/beta fold hydrolase n=1 Tax=Nocardia bovistercoris TaxID=2785916 RepID=A0A931ICZ3_9NOCA|nr:alpha/beta fold hydrolase [Nocardia bovistercoris]